MTDAILEKINNHILNGIKRESDVVYLLAQIRKVLEREDIKSKYPTLDLYCDWVLHPAIDGKKKEQILTKISETVAALENPDKVDNATALENLNNAISSEGLYRDMRNFFKENGLNDKFFETDTWNKFGELLIEVIQDIPLIASGKNLISQFSYAEAVDGKNSFRIRILLPDQRVYHGPMTRIGTNWSVGVVTPSGAADESDLED